MTGDIHKSDHARALGNTEQNWCRAVASGTGITVLALQMAKPPSEITAALAEILHSLQKRHPLLAYKLHYNRTTKTFSFLKPTTPTPHMIIKFHDGESTSQLLRAAASATVSPYQIIMEHELNDSVWSEPSSFPCKGIEVFYANVYALSDAKSVIVLRFHTSVCDRTTAVSLLRELMEMVAGSEGAHKEIKNEREGEMGIESMIPVGARKKTLWAHGIDVLGYSVNSLRLTNLTFENTKLPRRSEVVRLHMNAKYTNLILEVCYVFDSMFLFSYNII